MRNRLVVTLLALVLIASFATEVLAAPVLTDSLSVSSQGDVNRFYAGYWPRWAQSFTANKGGTLDSAVFWLDHAPTLGSHVGTVNAELWAITGTYGTNSIPTGVPIATSAPVDGSLVPDGKPGPVTFRFNNSVSLKQGARYAIVVRYAFRDAGATVEVARSTGSAAHPGNMSGFSLYYGNVWVVGTPAMADLIFSVYVNPTKTGTTLTFSAPSVCAYRSAKVSGYLKDVSGKPLANKSIVLQHFSAGAWRTASSVSTNASGYYSKTLTPVQKVTYRASFAGDASHLGKTSASRSVLPRARLTPTSAWDTKYDGTTYRYKGFVEPKHSTTDANKIQFKLYKRARDGKYYWKKTVPAAYWFYSDSKTGWTAKVVFPSPGSWKVRAYHAADSRNAAAYSSYDFVVVK